MCPVTQLQSVDQYSTIFEIYLSYINNQWAFEQNFYENRTLLVLVEINWKLQPRLCPLPEAKLYTVMQ